MTSHLRFDHRVLQYKHYKACLFQIKAISGCSEGEVRTCKQYTLFGQRFEH